MSAIAIPDPLPPAITPPRTVIEFLVDQDLEEFGDTGRVARTWHWVLHGGGPGPVSHMDGHSSTATDRHRWPPSPRKALPMSRRCTRPPYGPSYTRPDSSAGCAPPPRRRGTATVPPVRNGPAPAVTEDGSATVTMR